jgi:hypothetical protein
MRIALLFIASLAAQAATLTVCASGCGYTSVQAAINAASSGDEIVLTSGETFNENITIATKSNLIIRSSASCGPTGIRVAAGDPCLAKISHNGGAAVLDIGQGESVISQNGINTGTDVITFGNAIGLSENAGVVCWTILPNAMPGGITFGTTYYLKGWSAGPRTGQLSLTPGGAAVDITSVGTAGDAGYYVRPRCTALAQPSNLQFRGIHFEAGSSHSYAYIVNVGLNEQPTLAMGPNRVQFRKVVISAPTTDQTTATFGLAIAAGQGHVVEDSTIQGLQAINGVETKGIWVQNSRDVLIRNNYIAAASINLLTAGSNAASRTNVGGLSILGNFLEKPGYMMYRQGSGAPTGECYYGGGSGAFYRRTDGTQTCAGGACYRCQANGTWALASGDTYQDDDFLNKNLLELKDCDGCLIEGNYGRGAYAGADSGQGWAFSIVIGKGSGFGNGQHIARNVTMRYNYLDQVYRGMQIGNGDGGGGGTFNETPLQNVVVQHNLLTNFGRYPALSQFANSFDMYRRCLVPYGGATLLDMSNNTCRPSAANAGSRNAIFLSDGAHTSESITDLRLKNNIAAFNGEGSPDAFSLSFPPASANDCTANGIGAWIPVLDTTKRVGWNIFFGGTSANDWINGAGCTSTIASSNQWAANDAAVGFVSASDARLAGGSGFITSGEGSTVPGADVDVVESLATTAAEKSGNAYRLNVTRSGSTVTLRIDDPSSACTIGGFGSATNRYRSVSAVATTGDSVSGVRRTVTWTSANALFWRATCGSNVMAGSL